MVKDTGKTSSNKSASEAIPHIMRLQSEIFEYSNIHNFHLHFVTMTGNAFKIKHQNPWRYIAQESAKLSETELCRDEVITELNHQIECLHAKIDWYKQKFGNFDYEFLSESAAANSNSQLNGKNSLPTNMVSPVSSVHTNSVSSLSNPSPPASKTPTKTAEKPVIPLFKPLKLQLKSPQSSSETVIQKDTNEMAKNETLKKGKSDFRPLIQNNEAQGSSAKVGEPTIKLKLKMVANLTKPDEIKIPKEMKMASIEVNVKDIRKTMSSEDYDKLMSQSCNEEDAKNSSTSSPSMIPAIQMNKDSEPRVEPIIERVHNPSPSSSVPSRQNPLLSNPFARKRKNKITPNEPVIEEPVDLSRKSIKRQLSMNSECEDKVSKREKIEMEAPEAPLKIAVNKLDNISEAPLNNEEPKLQLAKSPEKMDNDELNLPDTKNTENESQNCVQDGKSVSNVQEQTMEIDKDLETSKNLRFVSSEDIFSDIEDKMEFIHEGTQEIEPTPWQARPVSQSDANVVQNIDEIDRGCNSGEMRFFEAINALDLSQFTHPLSKEIGESEKAKAEKTASVKIPDKLATKTTPIKNIILIKTPQSGGKNMAIFEMQSKNNEGENKAMEKSTNGTDKEGSEEVLDKEDAANDLIGNISTAGLKYTREKMVASDDFEPDYEP